MHEPIGIPEEGITKQQGVVSEDEARALSEPQVTLYMTRSPESQQAARLLDEAGIGFRAVPSPRRKATAAEFGGLYFRGLPEIQVLTDMLQEASSVFISGLQQEMPKVFRKRDPRLQRFMKMIHRQQVNEAQAILAEMTTAPTKTQRHRAR